MTVAVRGCPTSGLVPVPPAFKMPRSPAVVPPSTSCTERLSPVGYAASGSNCKVKPVGVTLTSTVRPAGGFRSIIMATSPSVWAPLRLTMRVLWPSEMAMLPEATPWPPLRSARGVSAESAGVSAAPWMGWEIAPKA